MLPRSPLASRVFSAGAIALFAAASATACESRVSLGGACAYESQCPAELACRFGRCRAECLTSVDCAPGAICIGAAGQGVCTVPTDTCDPSRPCEPGLVCAESRCTTDCRDDPSVCRPGTYCGTVAELRACVPGTSDAGVPGDAPEPMDALDGGATAPQPRTLCLGSAHACAIRDGRVFCWGAASNGELGDSDSPSSLTVDHPTNCGRWDCAGRPERAVRRRSGTMSTELTGVNEIACADLYTCALEGDSVWCWGSVGNGVELGHDGLGYVAQQTIASGATSIALGRTHGCAGGPGGHRCWGQNQFSYGVDGGVVEGSDGRLGFVGPSTRTPTLAPAFTGAFDVVPGGFFTCAARPDEVRCVGFNESDVTGLGSFGPDPVGRPVAGLVHPVQELSAGAFHACALSGGRIYCWGGGFVLASPTEPPVCFERALQYTCRADAQPIHLEVGFDAEPFRALSRGNSETMCAVTSDGHVACWGENVRGQAGLDLSVQRADIVASVVRLEAGGTLDHVVETACGTAFCCARRDDDAVFCWGENDLGQLGNGTSDSESFDADVYDGGPTASVGHPLAVQVLFSVP